ncbi:hypothetical protein [Clostridium saccharoperbutylacetonicum]|uniref:hypothetical protein n=1 Tax=Clostridium saccharoperbutylacetonicum TaxID=36745 RepID=UPI0039EC5713
MDKFEKYILDQIDFYREEMEREPSEKDTNLCLIDELLNVLVKYRTVGGAR